MTTLVHVTTTDMSLDWLLAPQLKAFVAAGYDVIGMSAPGEHVEHLAALGVRHVAIPSFSRGSGVFGDLRAFVQLFRALRVQRPDIVHTHNPKPGILGRIAARVTGVPLVINTQHGLYAQPTDRRRRRWPVYAAERIAAAFSHLELVQNPEDVDTLIHTLRVPARRVQLLGNGIDLAHFDPSAVTRADAVALRREWGVGDDEVLVGTVGRLVAEKGIAEICAAARAVRATAADVRFVIIGPRDIDKADGVDEALISAAEADGVVFAGARRDMPTCYAALDIYVTASWREGFPRAAMEAAAMGLPIVATDVRGNRQVVADDVNGVLCAVRDPQSLAAALQTLIGDRTRRLRLGEGGRRRATEEFDHEVVISRTLQAYQQARTRSSRFGRRGTR